MFSKRALLTASPNLMDLSRFTNSPKTVSIERRAGLNLETLNTIFSKPHLEFKPWLKFINFGLRDYKSLHES